MTTSNLSIELREKAANMRAHLDEKLLAWPNELRARYRSLATDLEAMAVKAERLADDFISYKETIDQRMAEAQLAHEAKAKQGGSPLADFTNKALREGKSDEEIFAAIKAAFPDCKTHIGYVRWRRRQLTAKAEQIEPRKPRKWSAKAKKRVKLRNSARKAWQKRREGAPGYASPSMTELRKQRRERQKETRSTLDKINKELLSSAAIPNDDEGQLGFTIVGSSH